MPIVLSTSELAGYIDHTMLDVSTTAPDIRRLCQEATEFGFKAVCVRPRHAAWAVRQLAESPVLVAAVLNFPAGDAEQQELLDELASLLYSGVDEIDYVMALPAALSGDWDKVADDLSIVLERAHVHDVRVKVIIEACLLSDAEKVQACQVALAGGADFIKTSTGYSQGGATLADVRLLRASVGEAMGVKASGGIHDQATALAMIEAGASRIGTSHGLAIIGD